MNSIFLFKQAVAHSYQTDCDQDLSSFVKHTSFHGQLGVEYVDYRHEIHEVTVTMNGAQRAYVNQSHDSLA